MNPETGLPEVDEEKCTACGACSKACPRKIIVERGEKLAAPPSAALSEIVRREPYPVKGKAEEILHRLKEFGMTRFKLLFRGSRSRSEIVATFIAVLELCREKVIHLAGSDTDCTVECGDDAPDRINL